MITDKIIFWRAIQISGIICWLYNLGFIIAQMVLLLLTNECPNFISYILATMQGVTSGISVAYGTKEIKRIKKWQK